MRGEELYRHIYDNVTPREQEGMLQRFETECEILNELKHPKIVQFLGVHFEAGSELPTLVMEFMHTTLSACLDRYGKLPEEISYTILDDVATALCFLHGQNPPVIHRDLTANNVLLTADMRAKVSDLGVAKILTPAQRTQMTMCPGTPAYMPPEALEHNPTYDTGIDTFSYGVLMLHVACGQWPIPEVATRVDPSNPNQLIPLSEVERRAPHFQELDPNHPLRPLINRCLSNHPPDRPSAEEILHQVREVLAQQPVPCEDKVALLNQHREEKHALQEKTLSLQEETLSLQEEVCGLREEVQQLTGEVQRHEQTEELLHNRLRAVTVETERLNSCMEAKIHEIAAKDQEIAAKEQVFAAKLTVLEEASASNEVALRTKDDLIQTILQQSEGMIEHIASVQQRHKCVLTPDIRLTWREGTNMPVATTSPQCTMINGKIYVGGGRTHDETHQYHLCIYIPVRDEWSTARCPVKLFGIGHLDGRPVIVGGCYPSGLFTGDGFVFNEQSQSWNDSIPPMPTARARSCVISSSSGIAVCGGYCDEECIASVEVFLSATRQWHSSFPFPQPLLLMRATIIHDTCYLFGGNFPGRSSAHARGHCFCASLTALFDTELDTSQSTPWRTIDAPPQSAPADLFGVLAAVGGEELSEVRAFSPSTQKWIHVGDLPHKRSYSTCVTRGLELFVFGGWVNISTRQRTNTVLIGTLENV